MKVILQLWFWYAALLHFWWGVSLYLAHPLPLADANGGVMWNVYAEVGGILFWSYFMLIASLLAIFGMVKKLPLTLELILLIPQQIVLTVGALGIAGELMGLLHDFPLSRVLRVAPAVLGVFLCHSIALAYYAVTKNNKD